MAASMPINEILVCVEMVPNSNFAHQAWVICIVNQNRSFMANFIVIFKDITGPDDTCQGDLQA